jgi:hypothetical protein
MVDVAPGIVTFGLGAGPTSVIIGNIFNLGFKVDIIGGSPIIPPVIPPVGGGGGGSRPLPPGAIKNFYKPVEEQPLYKADDKKYPITIRVTFRGKVTEKTYIVARRRKDIIVTVVNLINVARERVSIVVKNITKIPSRIMTIVKNIRNKDVDE